MKWYTVRLLFIILCSGLSHSALRAQVNGDLFWKNRVQYSDDFNSKWIYDTDHFTIYWYGKSRASAMKVIAYAEMDFDNVRHILEHRIGRPIEILVFADLTDLKQSNLGNEQAFTHTSKVAKVYGNKILAYYDGDTRHLRQQIREGIALVILRSMLYGDFLKEVFQKTYLKRMPVWFESGLASYCGSAWNPSIETALHQAYSNGVLDLPFEDWARENPVIAGHALWYYMAQHYGANSISDFLYLIRINKEIYESTFFALGEEWEDVIAGMRKYYKDHYGKIDPLFKDIAEAPAERFLKIKHDPPLSSIDRHPEKELWAISVNDQGKRRVYLAQKTSQSIRLKTIFKSGSYNEIQPPDLSYPQAAWAPDGSFLAVVNERRDLLYLKRYNDQGALIDEQALRPEIRRVFSLDVTKDGDLLLVVDMYGFTDLILYTPSNRNIHPLLQDFWDDPEACYFVNDKTEGAIISSNRKDISGFKRRLRIDTLLPGGAMDLFFVSWDEEKHPEAIHRLSNTPGIDERQPRQIAPDAIAYYSDRLGRYHIYRSSLHRGTDTLQGELCNLFLQSTGKYFWEEHSGNILLDAEVEGDKHLILRKKPQYPTLSPFSGWRNTPDERSKKEQDPIDSTKVLPYDPLHFFQSPFPLPPSVRQTLPQAQKLTSGELLNWITGENKNKKGKPERFNSAAAYAYLKQFRLYDLSTKLDNSPLFDGLIAYENIAGKGLSSTPIRTPAGLLMKMHLKELFEDYDLITGMRVTSGLDSWEQYVQWVNKKHLIDKTWTFYRNARRHSRTTPSLEPIFSKDISLVAQYQLKYPFDVYRSIRTSASFRQERSFDLISDLSTIDAPAIDRQRFGFKVEYVMDNTMIMDLNLLRGTRYNIGIEWLKRFAVDISPFSFSFKEPWMLVGRWDFRHYIPVFKHSVFAMRWAGAMSYGPEKILYLLGGTSDELNYSINRAFPVPPDINFGYKTVAPPLRGFSYNARNGSSYTVANAEFRWPFMKYFSARPSKWSFIRYLQLVGFADAGMGWYGWNPFDPENNQNIQEFENPAVKLRVKFYTYPILIGYGFGLRSSLLGYYLRLDYGWGYANGEVQSPKLHLSLGLDF